jgi:hypothetical protein
VVFAWGNFVVAACYISQYCGLSVFEEVLDSVGLWLSAFRQYRRCPALVLGNFNAKSALCGSPRTDRRGRLLGEWTAGFDLCVVNSGSELTCVRRLGGSIVDITLATIEALRRNWGWEVATEETASDHRYIRMMVSPLIASPAPMHSRPGKKSPRWSLRQLNEDALMAVALAVTWPEHATGMEEDGEVVPRGDVASLRHRHAPGLLAPPGQVPGVLVDGGGRGAQTRLRGLPTPVPTKRRSRLPGESG